MDCPVSGLKIMYALSKQIAHVPQDVASSILDGHYTSRGKST